MIPSMSSARSSASVEQELEALRRELMQTPILEEAEAVAGATKEASSDSAGARADIEKVLRELREKFAEATDDAEELIVAHPFASVAAAFGLGFLLASTLLRR